MQFATYLDKAQAMPHFTSLVALMAWNAEQMPDNLFMRFFKRGEVTDTLTYGEAWVYINRWAAMLADAGVGPGKGVVMPLPNIVDFVGAYYGTLLLGGLPAPSAPIRKLADNDPYLETIADRALFLDTDIIVVPADQASLATTAPIDAYGLRVVTAADLPDTPPRMLDPVGGRSDTGLIQFTSGTSGTPKAVVLSNGALLGQAHAISDVLQLIDIETEAACTWLPLFHDMGLIGYMLTPTLHAGPVNMMQTEDFVMRPGLWIKTMSETRATISGGPPSALSLVARRMKPSEVEKYDLSNVRVMLVGAEQVTPEPLEQFMKVFGPRGFRETSLMPTYGMAENGLAVTMPRLFSLPHFDRVDPIALAVGRAEPVAEGGRAVAALGPPCLDMTVVIRDDDGQPLPDRRVGHITVDSPTLMDGYLHNPQRTAEALRDGWLWTGDAGYMVDGQLYMTGRLKEVLIVGGRNYYPDDIEAVAADVQGVRMGRVVAVSFFDEDRATEAIAVLAETGLSDDDARADLVLRLRRTVVNAGYPISQVRLLPPKAIQATLNGKLKRMDARDRFLAGEWDN